MFAGTPVGTARAALRSVRRARPGRKSGLCITPAVPMLAGELQPRMSLPLDFPNWWRRLAGRLGGAAAASEMAATATSDVAEGRARDAAATGAPVVWLLGKVQSGKSSIVQRLTGASAAEIGEGFRPMTRTASVFDFPAEAPLLRFLDTRGLGESGYDPTDDLRACEDKAHLLIVVLRAGDPAQAPVIDALHSIRERHPDWPLIVAQTWLHALYARPPSHVLPYPFTGLGNDASLPGVPEDLSRALMHQRALFAGLPGAGRLLFVPLDFTRPEDGLAPADYGLEALLAAIEVAAPMAVQNRLSALRAIEGDRIGARAHKLILGYAFAAAASDVVPAVGAVAVTGVQGAMLHALARRYGVAWRREDVLGFLGGLGTAALAKYGLSFGVRQLVKLVPVYGQTAGAATAAAASFAFTYALGLAARVYLAARHAGEQPSDAAVKEAYAAGLRDALAIFRTPRDDETRTGGNP